MIRSGASLALCALALLGGRAAAQGAAPDTLYDIVIRNGRVLDGEGNPWILADVAIKDGRFAKIGTIAAHGKRDIDARGKYVSPGWIDMMDQSGSVLRRNGLAENKLQESVTTAIGGEGGTPVPPARWPSSSTHSSAKASASTSAATSARRGRARRYSACRRESRTPRRRGGC
jgi:N-acyl-D-aspartate/D-glutamate deacylase